MSGGLLGRLRRAFGGGKYDPVDPASFGDPIAERTEWTPVAKGGSSFRTHELRRVRPGILEFRATAGARAFYVIFIVMGAAVGGGITLARLAEGSFGGDLESLFPALIGVVFVTAGVWMLRRGTRPIVFDRRRSFFWKGRMVPGSYLDREKLDDFAALEDIHALQILPEYVRGNKSSYYSYELNLVLSDGSRRPVVDHGNLDRLREDAATLAQFLECPVWDAAS